MYQELIEGIKRVRLAELRQESADYFEVVAFNNDLAQLKASFESFFGPSYWPPHEQLPASIQGYVDDSGGIQSGQVLYFCSNGNNVVIAMLWPWRDGQRTTLKIMTRLKQGGDTA